MCPPDGRLRRLIFCEFVALGGLPYCVGFGSKQHRKTFSGNTWDWNLTNLTVRAALEYMQPWLHVLARGRGA